MAAGGPFGSVGGANNSALGFSTFATLAELDIFRPCLECSILRTSGVQSKEEVTRIEFGIGIKSLWHCKLHCELGAGMPTAMRGLARGHIAQSDLRLGGGGNARFDPGSFAVCIWQMERTRH